MVTLKEGNTMKFKTKKYVVSQMIRDYEKKTGQKNRLVFNCPIQRPEGQWPDADQSLLIHSILQEYYIPNICLLQNDSDDFEPMTVLDGKQRMTIIYNFVTLGFKLSKTTPPVKIIVPEVDTVGNLIKDEKGLTKTHIELIEIKNKKFNQLSKEFQDKIKNYELNATIITKASETELEEQMFRLNNGKSLTSTHKAFMKAGISITEAIIKNLLCNTFFSNRFDMSNSQEKSREDMKCALYVLAVLTNSDFNKYETGNLEKFSESMKIKWSEGSISKLDIKYCNDFLEKLNMYLPNQNKFDSKEILTTVHIPIMVMNVEKANQMIDDKELTLDKYKDFLKYWVNDGFYDKEYTKCSINSPFDKKNIEHRINYMEKRLCDFIKS